MTKRLVLLAVPLLLLALPPAQAHASPDPLDNEVQLLADDTDDSYAFYDGFDLQDLYVREAYDRDAEEDGLMFRMIVYGGFAPAKVASSLHLDLAMTAAGSEQTFRISSTDGTTWEGDLKVVEAMLEAEEPTGTLAGSIQAWVPLSALGVGANDTVGGFRWSSYADEDIRDVAPGGRFLPGTGGAGAIEAESRVTTESITLAGPQGYTRSTARAAANGTVTVEVENLITVVGQHVVLSIPQQAGWETRLLDVEPKAVEPGQHPVFTFRVDAASDEDLLLELTTDLGGRETIPVPAARFARAPDGTVDPDATTPDAPDAQNEDSPLGLPVLLAAVAVALLVRRRAR